MSARLRRLGELLDDHRRPPMLVAWGGRPGIDIQLGSRRDRRRTLRMQHMARVLRSGRALEQAMRQTGQAAIDAMRPVARLAGRCEGVDEDTMLERWGR